MLALSKRSNTCASLAACSLALLEKIMTSSTKTCSSSPTKCFTRSIKRGKFAGLFDRPNGSRLNSKCPDGTVNPVRSLCSFLILTCQNPLKQSSTEKYLDPCMVDVVS